MEPPEEICRDDGFPRTGREGEKNARGFAFDVTLQDFLESRTNGGVLVVTRLWIGGAVRLKEKRGRWGIQINARVAMIAVRETLVIGEVGKRKRAGLLARERDGSRYWRK